MIRKTSLETWPPYVFSNYALISSESIKNERLMCIDTNSLKLSTTLARRNEIIAPVDWYEIKIKYRWKQVMPNGYQLLVANDGRITNINIEDIKALNGDVWIATPKNMPDSKVSCSQQKENLFSYICYFAGDGYRRRGNEIVLSVDDIGMFNNIKNLCKNVFNYDIPNEEYWKNKILNNEGKCFNIRVGATKANMILDELQLPEGKKNDIISIPNKFLRMPAKTLIKYGLTSLIETDGHVEDVRIRYATTSWKLALQVFFIYLKANLQPNFEKVYQPLNGKIFHRYVVGLSGIRQLKKLRELGFELKHNKKEFRLQIELSKNLPLRRSEGIIPSEIIQPTLRHIIKKFNVDIKELSKISNLPLGTLRCYLAPNVKPNISVIRAQRITNSLKEMCNENFTSLTKLCYSGVHWCKIVNINKIPKPNIGSIPKFYMKDKILASNLIFMS